MLPKAEGSPRSCLRHVHRKWPFTTHTVLRRARPNPALGAVEPEPPLRGMVGAEVSGGWVSSGEDAGQAPLGELGSEETGRPGHGRLG